MKNIIKAMEERLTESDKKLLRSIYAPTVLETPLSDSRADVCILPTGEIRSYGSLVGDRRFDGTDLTDFAYLSSFDCGLSWKPVICDSRCMGACTMVEDGHYVKLRTEKDGTFALLSDKGPDDTEYRSVKVSDNRYFDIFLPVRSAFSKRIWATAQRRLGDPRTVPAFFYSDDFGENWSVTELSPLPVQEVVFPHKGPRWSIGCGVEPYAVELSEDEMMMILRNSTDAFYKCYSHDGGKNWSEPVPSEFYGDATTAFLLRLTDGRVITFWNNTKPLSELNHKKQSPPLDKDILEGVWEDGFTNRDAAHAAITTDGGKSWIGYREILLNDVRTAVDFRSAGGIARRLNGEGKMDFDRDKSVHQFQAFELPYGKILVSAGQNPVSRKLLLFDVQWLFETERKESFLAGLGSVSYHSLLKSVAGSTMSEECNGHCSFNRIPGAVMMQDPERLKHEAVLIEKHHDEKRLSDVCGVVWNFPVSKKGKVTAEIKLIEKSVRITLSDRWYNPCDPYAGLLSPFFFELDTDDIGTDFVRLEAEYDTEKGRATVKADGSFVYYVDMRGSCPAGISYIMVQCAADGDSKGLYLRLLEKE